MKFELQIVAVPDTARRWHAGFDAEIRGCTVINIGPMGPLTQTVVIESETGRGELTVRLLLSSQFVMKEVYFQGEDRGIYEANYGRDANSPMAIHAIGTMAPDPTPIIPDGNEPCLKCKTTGQISCPYIEVVHCDNPEGTIEDPRCKGKGYWRPTWIRKCGRACQRAYRRRR